MKEIVIQTGMIRRPSGLIDKLLHGSVFNDSYVFEKHSDVFGPVLELLLSGMKEPKKYKIVLQVEE